MMKQVKMASIPAFCDDCGASFPSGIGGGGNATFVMNMCKSGPCPSCGGMGTVLDGAYQLDAGIIKVLCAPESTRERLLGLKQLLIHAKAAGATPAQVGEILSEAAPEFSKLAAFLPKTPADLFAFLSLIVALISLVVACNQGPVISEDELTRAFSRALQGTEQVRPSERAPAKAAPQLKAPSTIAPPHPSRGQPCPCGSGKKYKRCCDSGTLPPAQRLMQT